MKKKKSYINVYKQQREKPVFNGTRALCLSFRLWKNIYYGLCIEYS